MKVLHLDIFGVALVVLQGLLQQRHRQHDDQRKDVGVGVDGAAAGDLGLFSWTLSSYQRTFGNSQHAHPSRGLARTSQGCMKGWRSAGSRSWPLDEIVRTGPAIPVQTQVVSSLCFQNRLYLHAVMASTSAQRTFGRNVIHVYLVVCIALSCMTCDIRLSGLNLHA